MNEPEPNLKDMYRSINKLLFDDTLPDDYRVIFVPTLELIPYGGYDEEGEHDGVTKTIKLTEPLRDRPEALRRLLIHEMAHAAESDEHDEAFFNRLIDIARRGEEWAWNEARVCHPCSVRRLIHQWNDLHPLVQEDLKDPRCLCRCDSCVQWVKNGCPSGEQLKDWHPWEPEGAPPPAFSDWIEKRAYELKETEELHAYDALVQAQQEASAMEQTRGSSDG